MTMELTAEQIKNAKKWKAPEGFSLVAPPEHQRLVMSVWGEQKTGKSSLALSFPKPIFALNLDMGIDELFISRPELYGEVFQRKLEMNELNDPGTWGELLGEFYKHYLEAIASAEESGGTVLVDTATQLWQVVQCVKVDHVRQERIKAAEAKTYRNEQARQEAIERAAKPSQMDYNEANAWMGGILRRPLHKSRVNAVFINRAKPKYDGPNKTDLFEYHGFGEMPAIVQVHVQTIRKGTEHFARITDCRFNSSLSGLEIKDPTFEILSDLIYS